MSEMTTLFIKSLLQRGDNVLGKQLDGTVVCIPPHFDDAERAVLEKLAVETGVNVLRLLDEAGGAAATASDFSQATPASNDHI